MKYTSFFNFEQYHHPHKRHDPPGSEDADVNNDGKVDKNDKYIMAKRRLYKQYQSAQKSNKATDFSTPQLENDMIRLMGLVELPSITPLKKEETIPTATLNTEVEKGGKRDRLAMTLKKLKEMQMTPDQEKKVDELLAQYEELTDKQKQLDVDKDGKIEADDLAKLRASKKDEVVAESEDHEVSMASSTLDSIIRHATELKGKIGMDEKDIPAWIQDHIAVAENNLDQANTSYHEYDKTKDVPHPEMDKPVDKDLEAMKETVNEAAPEGWEKTVLAMKKHKEIDNPWALAHWMKKKGYQSHKKEN